MWMPPSTISNERKKEMNRMLQFFPASKLFDNTHAISDVTWVLAKFFWGITYIQIPNCGVTTPTGYHWKDIAHGDSNQCITFLCDHILKFVPIAILSYISTLQACNFYLYTVNCIPAIVQSCCICSWLYEYWTILFLLYLRNLIWLEFDSLNEM